MAKKYGVDIDGDIYRENKNFYFPKELKHICDTEVELEVCDEDYKSLLGKYQNYYRPRNDGRDIICHGYNKR